jgi:hypothetical protein
VAEKSLDNITVVVVAFKNFRKALKAEIDKYSDDLRKQREANSNNNSGVASQIED